jgi:hypothetical protein
MHVQFHRALPVLMNNRELVLLQTDEWTSRALHYAIRDSLYFVLWLDGDLSETAIDPLPPKLLDHLPHLFCDVGREIRETFSQNSV